MSDDHLDRLDYYTLLGVAQDASAEDIRRAFRAFARKYHPDKYPGPEERRARATAIYRRGSEALEVLIDPAARQRYDAELGRGRVRITAAEREGASRKEAPKKAESQFKSPQAKVYYERALAMLAADDVQGAYRLLYRANEVEPNNFIIEARLDQVAGMLRR